MLEHVHITNNDLVAETDTGKAISEIITQEDGQTDFESVRDVRVRWKLQNICDGTRSTADKAIVNSDINEGDRIIIIDQNNKPYETVATGVKFDLGNSNGLIPNMTSATEPSGKVVSGSWGIFSGVYHKTYSRGSTIYEFPEPVKATSFYISVDGNNYNGGGRIYGAKIEGSNDGNNFIIIGEPRVSTSRSISKILNIFIPGLYKFYKVSPICNSTPRLFNVQLYGDSPSKSIDTSAATNGKVPKYVYRFEDVLKFNSTVATEKDKYFEFGTYGDSLYVQNLYNDVLISGRTIQTEVDFSATGNVVMEITGQIFKKPDDTGAA